MKNHFSVRFKNMALHWKLRLIVILLVVGVPVLMASYWIQLEASNTQLRQDTLALADQHTEQLAMAVARQAEDLIRGVDISLQHMRHDYLEDPKSFEESVNATRKGYPDGVILNIAVFDSKGESTYHMVSASARVKVSDRDYFQAQAASSVDRVDVNRAVMGRVSAVWTIPVSRKLLRNGRFAGVIVVFLRADYVSHMLARVALHEGDVISLFTQEGAYLSRSNDLEHALGTSAPQERPFLGPNAPRSGTFRLVSAYDKVPRIYGWGRLDELPLIINVGVDTRRILAPVEARIEHIRRINATLSILVLLGTLLGVGLLLHAAKQQSRIEKDGVALRISKAAFDATSEGMLVTDAQNRILMANPAFSQITGYTEQEVIGQTPSLLSSGKQDRDFYTTLWRTLNTQGHWEGEVTNRHKNGQLYVEWLKISVIDKDDPLRRQHIAVISDITARKRGEEIVWKRANYDELTGLPNRRLFVDRLKHTLARATRYKNGIAVLFIDLDKFKPVNDNYGHQVGDELLKQVAARTELCLREEDTVARQGGDEFVVMLATIPNEDEALAVAEKLLATLHDPFQIEGHTINIGASIGISLFPQQGETAEQLLKNADAAMYAAKSAGRHTVCLFSAETSESGREPT